MTKTETIKGLDMKSQIEARRAISYKIDAAADCREDDRPDA